MATSLLFIFVKNQTHTYPLECFIFRFNSAYYGKVEAKVTGCVKIETFSTEKRYIY